MTTNITNNPTNKQIDLTAMVVAYNATKKAERKAQSIKWVEENLLPQLVSLAKKGERFYQIKTPASVELEEVIKALHERAICTANRAGYRGEISITW